jgi:hypothetical protein
MKSKMLGAAFVLLGTVLSACGGGYGGGYYAGYAPPPPRYGVVGVAPGPGYVWTNGYWGRRGSQWYWRDGRWARPPHRGARWEEPRWERDGHGYRFHRGYWR